MKDLIIYELSTKSFTSPNGPESGTFASTKEKIPYIAGLGVTGIWLTGHNWADPNHFYNIWTQYAAIRPDVIDPTLGSEEEFRELVSAAHTSGMRVFLDVITHGVMSSSPLVQEHPEWFREGTWGMIDYDWYGNHPDLDDWWVKTWVQYVTDYGIDGYRLDVSMYRPDLWWRIKEQCKKLGAEIAVFNECGPGRRGVVDFLQMGIRYRDTKHVLSPTNQIMMRLPRHLLQVVRNDNLSGYDVSIETQGGEVWTTGRINSRPVRIVDAYLEQDADPVPPSKETFGADHVVLKLAAFDFTSHIERITVAPCEICAVGSFGIQEWSSEEGVKADYRLKWERKGNLLVVKFPQQLPEASYVSIQGSCHDDGWEGFPANENPYVTGMSRCFFGYALTLAPAIPIFMAGHEFAASFVPLPRLAPDLFGRGEAGKGTWLYGSWIQWDQLEHPGKAEMLHDAKKLISLRKTLSDLIFPMQTGKEHETFFEARDFQPGSLPTPYGYGNQDHIVIVAGNPYEVSKSLSITLPWHSKKIPRARAYRVKDLWNSEAPETELEHGSRMEVNLPADNVLGGGLGVWELVPEN